MVRKLLQLAMSLGLLACSPAHGQACQCANIGDIQSRLIEAQTAMQAFALEFQKLTMQMLSTRQPVLYTPQGRIELRDTVQAALNQAMAHRSGTGVTGGTTNICTIQITSEPWASACIIESATKHEEYHQAQCKKTLSASAIAESVRTGMDRFERDRATLQAYAAEEIGGYAVEIRFLQSELQRLSSSDACKPKPRPAPQLRDYSG